MAGGEVVDEVAAVKVVGAALDGVDIVGGRAAVGILGGERVAVKLLRE